MGSAVEELYRDLITNLTNQGGYDREQITKSNITEVFFMNIMGVYSYKHAHIGFWEDLCGSLDIQ